MTTESVTTKRFLGTYDLVVTPIIESILLSLSALAAFFAFEELSIGVIEAVLIFYLSLNVVTLIAISIIKKIAPLKPGIYAFDNDSAAIYPFNLVSFLCICNLSPFYMNSLIPPLLRRYFYSMLGAKIGGGIVSIGGRLLDPQLITIGDNVMIGDEAILLPHSTTPNYVILGRINIGSNSIIGARAVIMPGVVVGENSVVGASSLVATNTRIPRNEIWAGMPAKKIGDVSTPIKRADNRLDDLRSRSAFTANEQPAVTAVPYLAHSKH